MVSEVSAWVRWVCPGCGFMVTRHEETPLEAWCVYCHRPLEADPEIERKSLESSRTIQKRISDDEIEPDFFCSLTNTVTAQAPRRIPPPVLAGLGEVSQI